MKRLQENMSPPDAGNDPIAVIIIVIIVIIAGFVGLGIIVNILKCLNKLANTNIDQGTQRDTATFSRENIVTRETEEEFAALSRNNIVTRKTEEEIAASTRNNRVTGKIEEEVPSILGRITIELLEKPVRFSSDQICAATRNYTTKLGSGGFGDVYEGDIPGCLRLAVKVLKNNGLEKRLEEQFMAEVGTIGRTYHVNLVRLFGYCFEHDIKALVYEYMENGSLDNVLFDNRIDIKWEKLYEIAVGAAKGLEYLHHLGRQRIIHYDIKPANILIDSQFCAKIADFGLAKLCNKDSTHVTFSGCGGTPGYAAPELWMPFPVTYKCDVYSFGMTLFEIIGRNKNFRINSSESQEWFPRRVWEKYDKGELEELILDAKIEEDRDRAKTMAMVALWCVQYLPEARPSMSSVVKILENEVEVKKPPNPFQHLLSSNAELPQWIETSSNSTTSCATFDDNNSKSSTPVMKKYEIGFASFP